MGEGKDKVVGAIFSKVMWVGRATTFCIGLAVVLAVVFGIATTALAAVPGDPFRLGRVNTVDQLTTLAGTVAGPLLKLDNNGTGSALSLETEAGVAPMKVSAGSGKVTNLNADKLDGKDSGDFLAANGKATDSAHADKADTATSASSAATAGDANTLDGKDSTAFLGADQKAADAEMLDGKDSGQFMRNFSSTITAQSTRNSSTSKGITVQCPATEIAIGGFAEIKPISANQIPVALQSVGSYGKDLWRADAMEMVPYDGDWILRVSVQCVATPTTEISDTAREATTQSHLRDAAAAATACAAENNGSYVNCATIGQLLSYGYRQNSNVTFVVTTATATRWVARAQHNDGGSAYQFDTAAVQQITAIPRF